MEFKEYKKFKWFFTFSKKLVVGGKNSAQNDELLKYVKKENKEMLVMHTQSPGSPFCVIFSDIDKISKEDEEEAAIFTACFSKAWKSQKQIAVHSFYLSDIYKQSSMKEGTWGVKNIQKEYLVKPELALIRQEKVLKAVPLNTAKKSEIILYVYPGKIEKKELLAKVAVIVGGGISEAELMAALPAGGIKIKEAK